MLLLTDLLEVKSLLGISMSNNCDDKLLGFLIEHASNWIQEWLGRDLEYKQRTEYYNGSGTIYLPLRARPVYATGLQVRVDERGFYGTPTDAFDDDPLEYGSAYCLAIDQDDGTSRSGLLVRIDRPWRKALYGGRGMLSSWMGPSPGSIKVTYNAGYNVDTLPGIVRHACALVVARMKYVLPLGMELTSDSYEVKSIAMNPSEKNYLMSQILKPMLLPYRNWTFGGGG